MEIGVEQNGSPAFYARRRPHDSKLDTNKTTLEQFNPLRIVDNKRYPAYFDHMGKIQTPYRRNVKASRMKQMKIGKRIIGDKNPAYVIAEVSCNHEWNCNEARKIIETAAQCGADAVKLQTYTADTISRNFKTQPKGTIWEKLDLYKLYEKAHTPWEWSRDLKKVADDNGVDFFSSPFDETAVDFLVDLGVDVLKLASFEVVDNKLIEHMAKTGLPIIMSNGMTDFLEMKEAVDVLRKNNVKDLAILHCNSGYPAAFEEANLKTIPVIGQVFDVVTGLSDHTLFADTANYAGPQAHVTPVEAQKYGAKIIEVHLMLDRAHARSLFDKGEGGFDWPFSREPAELKKTIDMIRHYEKTGEISYETEAEKLAAEKTHGHVSFEPTAKEMNSRNIRPSLWVVNDIQKGEPFEYAATTRKGNLDSIRPSGGLHIRFADMIVGKKARRDIKAGEPLTWEMVDLQEQAGTNG
jgi:sialic acid synthase SpsE